MKKIFAAALLLLMFSVLALNASAAESNGMKEQIGYFDEEFIDLQIISRHGNANPNSNWDNDQFADLKQQILDAIQEMHASGRGPEYFTVENTSGQDLTTSDLAKVYFNTLYDYPEKTYFAKTGLSYYLPQNRTAFAPGEKIRIKPVFLELDADAYTAALEKACLECFGSADGKNTDMTDLEKISAAHDWLVLNTIYDPYVYNGGTYITEKGVVYDKDELVYTSFGPFVNGRSVCQGYALAFKVLMDRAGVQCCYVSSDSMNHAWNMVKLGENWYHVDCTWDDPIWIGIGDYAGVSQKEYFLFSDGDSREHSGWSTEYGYTCEESYTLPECMTGNFSDVFYNDDALYAAGTSGIYVFEPGTDFTRPVNSYPNNKRYAAAALDRTTDTLYAKLYYENRIVSFDLSTMESRDSYYPSPKGYGVGLRESETMPGTLVLYTVYEYDRIDEWMLGLISTDTKMPVVFYYSPDIADGVLDDQYIMVETDAQTYTVILACYLNGRMVGVVELLPDVNGVIALNDVIDGLPAGTDGVKIFAVSDDVKVLAEAISVRV